MDGSSARSAATAEVMILLGPPTRQPMKAKRRRRIVTGISFMYIANIQRRGQRTPEKRREKHNVEEFLVRYPISFLYDVIEHSFFDHKRLSNNRYQNGNVRTHKGSNDACSSSAIKIWDPKRTEENGREKRNGVMIELRRVADSFFWLPGEIMGTDLRNFHLSTIYQVYDYWRTVDKWFTCWSVLTSHKQFLRASCLRSTAQR